MKNRRMLGLLMAGIMVFSNVPINLYAEGEDMHEEEMIIDGNSSLDGSDDDFQEPSVEDNEDTEPLGGSLFESDFKVIWNAGEGQISSEYGEDPSEYADEYVEGENIRPFSEQGLIAPENMVFNGWSIDGTEEGILDFDEYWTEDDEGGFYDYPIHNDMTITAIWKSESVSTDHQEEETSEDLCTVTWNAGEGKISSDYGEDSSVYVEKYTNGERIHPFSEQGLAAPAGKAFKGWSTDGTEEGMIDFEDYKAEGEKGDYYDYPVVEDLSFTAIWDFAFTASDAMREDDSDSNNAKESEEAPYGEDALESSTEEDMLSAASAEDDDLETDKTPDEAETVLMAADAPMSGFCGENLTWTLDSKGTLTIRGTGPMMGFYSDKPSELGSSPFCSRKDIKTVIILNGVTNIGRYAFYSCTSLSSVIIPNSVTSIDLEAFDTCTSLTSITIPNSVTSIGVGAFAGCTSLASITLPDSVTSIGNGAFRMCTSLTSISVPDSMTTIGWGIFYNCTSLSRVTIPDSVTSIGEHAFSGCNSLSSVTIPDSVTSIGEHAFSECKSLSSVTIPGSVTSIGSSAFSYCTSLASIIILNGVTSIGSSAFSYCTSLLSISIPKSVTSIGYTIVEGSFGIKDVYYEGSRADWLKYNYGYMDFYSATIHYNYIDYESAMNSGEGRLFTGKITEVTADAALSVPWYCMANGRKLSFSKEEFVTAAQTCLANDSYFISTIVDNVICEISEVPKDKFDLFGYCEENGDTSVTIDGTQYELCSMILHTQDVVQTALYKDHFVWFSLTADNKIAEIGQTKSFEGELSNYDAAAGTVKIKSSGGNGTYKINYAYMPEEALAFMSTMAEGAKAYVVTYQRTNWASDDFDPEHEGAPADYYLDPEVYLVHTDGGNVRNADFEFELYSDGTLGLVKYLGDSSEVIIREKQTLTSIPGKYTITKILDGAFEGCESVTKITVPDSVIEMASNVFENCTNLRELFLGTGIRQFPPETCAGCNSLTRITIPYCITNFRSNKNMSFPNIDQLTICGEEGSEAYVYAKEHHIKFEAIQGGYYSQAYKQSRDGFIFGNFEVPETPESIWWKVYTDNKKNRKLYEEKKTVSNNGVCYGMASVSGLQFNNKNFIGQWGDYSYIRELPQSASAGGTSLKDFILQQFIVQWTEDAAKEYHRNIDNYEGLIRAVTNFEKNQTKPVLLNVWNTMDGSGGHLSEHTVFPFAVDTTGGQIRIFVYDPNAPYDAEKDDAVTSADQGSYITIIKTGSNYGFRYSGAYNSDIYGSHFTFEYCTQGGSSDNRYGLLVAGTGDELTARLNGNNVNVLEEGNQFDENGNATALLITDATSEPDDTDNDTHLLAYLNPERSFRLQKNADPDEMTDTTYVQDDKELVTTADGKAVIDISGGNGLFSAEVAPGSSDKNVAFAFDNEGDVLEVSGSTDAAGKIQEQGNGDVVLSGFNEATITYSEVADDGTVTEKLNLTEELDGNAVLIDKRENGDIALKEDPDGDGNFNKNLTYIAVTGVRISSNTLRMEEKTEYTLSATTVPEDASELGITWMSSNSGVASVYQNGTVTAVSPGKAVITAKTVEGNFTASCTVTVIASQTEVPQTPADNTPAAIPETTAATEAAWQVAPAEAAGKDAEAAKEKITIAKGPASVKAKAKKNKVTVSWKKIKKNKAGKKLLKQIKSIEVQYSTDKTFKKDIGTKTVGKKKTKVTLKLQKKTTYYVRVRYKGSNGVSKWSKAKKVKTKK